MTAFLLASRGKKYSVIVQLLSVLVKRSGRLKYYFRLWCQSLNCELILVYRET